MSKRSSNEPNRFTGQSSRTSAHSELDADVDLAILVEEVVEAIYAGQTFRSTGAFHGNEEDGLMSPNIDDPATHEQLWENTPSKFSGAVRVILDIERAASWYVRTQPGAIRRIVMNLFGNALKYTEKGVVSVALRPVKRGGRSKSDVTFCITVSDTGKGMSTDFVKNHAWEAFSQEDSFCHGVGLGLSIVRQITNSLGGKVDLQSSQGQGTDVTIQLSVPSGLAPPNESQNELNLVARRVEGLKLCILDPVINGNIPRADVDLDTKRAEDTFERQVKFWFGMTVIRSSSIVDVEADFFVYVEPPSAEHLLATYGVDSHNTNVPLIIVSPNAFGAASLRRNTQTLKGLGRTLEIISQPCGPQKLARTFERSLDRGPFNAPPDIISPWSAESANGALITEPQVANMPHFPLILSPDVSLAEGNHLKSESLSSHHGSHTPKDTVSESLLDQGFSSKTSSNPPVSIDGKETPGDNVQGPVLLVDDNEVNLKLLVAFVRKAKFVYETATDGLQAVSLYKDASRDPRRAFKAVVIDIQMPVMDGITATREIRSFESRNRITPAKILALTGLAAEKTQQECAKAGVDQFLAKPVKFKEFLKLLER